MRSLWSFNVKSNFVLIVIISRLSIYFGRDGGEGNVAQAKRTRDKERVKLWWYKTAVGKIDYLVWFLRLQIVHLVVTNGASRPNIYSYTEWNETPRYARKLFRFNRLKCKIMPKNYASNVLIFCHKFHKFIQSFRYMMPVQFIEYYIGDDILPQNDGFKLDFYLNLNRIDQFASSGTSTMCCNKV